MVNYGTSSTMSAVGDYLPKITETATAFLPFIGQGMQAYRGMRNMMNLYKGFSEGGLKGGLRAGLSNIPVVGSFMGGMFGKEGGAEGKAIVAAVMAADKPISRLINKFSSTIREGKRTGMPREMVRAYDNLVNARESMMRVPYKGAEVGLISRAQQAAKKFVSIMEAGRGMGGGGRPLTSPQAGSGINLPKYQLPFIPSEQSGNAQAGSLGGINPIPAIAETTGYPVGRPVYQSSPYTESITPENPLSVQRIKLLRNILGGY